MTEINGENILKAFTEGKRKMEMKRNVINAMIVLFIAFLFGLATVSYLNYRGKSMDNVFAIINELSLKNGALAVALISGLLSGAFSYIPLARIKWLLALTVPFVIAYSIYWTPVWHDNSYTAVYSDWAPRFIVTWYGAGALVSMLVCYFISKAKRRKDGTKNG